MSHVILTNSTAVSAPDATLAAQTWDTAVQSGGTFWNASNPSRITVPTGVDKMEFHFFAGNAQSGNNAAPDLNFALYKNGSLLIEGANRRMGGAAALSSGLLEVVAGDYFELFWAEQSPTNYDYDNTVLSFSACTPGIVGAVCLQHDPTLSSAAQNKVYDDWIVDLNSRGAFNGVDTITIPTGCNAIKVGWNQWVDFFSQSRNEIRVNGTKVREGFMEGTGADFSNMLPTWGIIEVSPGDEVTFYGEVSAGSGDEWFQGSRISVEFLKDTTSNAGTIPVSPIHLVKSADFTFAGGVLTDVNPEVGPASLVTIVGSPTEGANGGYVLTTGTATNNYVQVDIPELDAASPSGKHLALKFRRNGTANDKSMLFGTSNNTTFIGAMDGGSSDTNTTDNITIDRYRTGGVEYTNPTRGTLHTQLVASTNTTRTVAIKDVSTNFVLHPGRYSFGTDFHMEGEILGWAVFTDWDDADDVMALL